MGKQLHRSSAKRERKYGWDFAYFMYLKNAVNTRKKLPAMNFRQH